MSEFLFSIRSVGCSICQNRSCATALSHPTYGTTMLRTSISISESLSKLVMALHRRPELTRRLRVAASEEESKSAVESNGRHHSEDLHHLSDGPVEHALE